MDTRLFLPGPVEVPEFIREAMSRPMVGHRTNAFRQVAKEVFAGLKTLLEAIAREEARHWHDLENAYDELLRLGTSGPG